MAGANLHASRDFFNEISIEIQQLKLVSDYIQTFVDRARERGYRTGDNQLLLILDHLESFISVIKDSCNRLEKIATRL